MAALCEETASVRKKQLKRLLAQNGQSQVRIPDLTVSLHTADYRRVESTLVWCNLVHATFGHPNERNPQSPPCGVLDSGADKIYQPSRSDQSINL